jgi:hypothetical protein
MWTQLTFLSDAEYRHLATLQDDSASTELAETIRLISGRGYSDQLAAVTSMGHLSLTTALEYGDQHHHRHHPVIGIRLTDEREISISYSPGGKQSPKVTASKDVNTPSEAADYVDLLMNRMLYDTAEVLEHVADAKSRKVAYENAMTEQGGGGQPATRPESK